MSSPDRIAQHERYLKRLEGTDGPRFVNVVGSSAPPKKKTLGIRHIRRN